MADIREITPFGYPSPDSKIGGPEVHLSTQEQQPLRVIFFSSHVNPVEGLFTERLQTEAEQLQNIP